MNTLMIESSRQDRPTPITEALIEDRKFISADEELIHVDHFKFLERQLAEAREEIARLNKSLSSASAIYDAVCGQRDRLADAIERHQTTLPYPPEFEDFELYSALAAVKGGEA